MMLIVALFLLIDGSYGYTYRNCFCPHPEPIGNGSYIGGGKHVYKPGSNLTYKCNCQFKLYGPETRTCKILENEAAEWWPREMPTCHPFCPQPEPIGNGSYVGGGKHVYEPGSNLTYKCNWQFKLYGPETRICKILENGAAEWWPREMPTCEPDMCKRVFCGGNEICTPNLETWTIKCECKPGFRRLKVDPDFLGCLDKEFYCALTYGVEDGQKIVRDAIQLLKNKSSDEAITSLVANKTEIINCTDTKGEIRYFFRSLDAYIEKTISSNLKLQQATAMFLKSAIDKEKAKSTIANIIQNIANDEKYSIGQKDFMQKLYESI